MGDFISTEISGDRDKLKKLSDNVRRILTDFDAIHENVTRPHMRNHVEEMYDSSGAHAGAEWMDYEESGETKYAAFKQAVVDGPNATKLLRWEDGMERLHPSLTNPSHPLHVERMNGAEFVFGTRVDYAYRLAVIGGINPFDEPYPPRPILYHDSAAERRLQKRGTREYPGINSFLRRRLNRELGIPVSPRGGGN